MVTKKDCESSIWLSILFERKIVEGYYHQLFFHNERRKEVCLYYSKCPKKIFTILQRLGVCSSYERVLLILDAEGNYWSDPLKKWNSEGRDIDVVIDNIDITIHVTLIPLFHFVFHIYYISVFFCFIFILFFF